VADDDLPDRSDRRDLSERFSLRTARMEAFSDGVFAIAITLLVLDLVVPEANERHVGHALLHEWPIYLAYLVSFASIGNAWLGHSAITEFLDHADSLLFRINLLLLFFVSLLPFPTHMLANFLNNPNSERVAVTIYGINLFAISGLISVIWHYAHGEGLIKGDVDDEELRVVSSKVDPSLLSYGVVIVVGLLLPRLAVVLYLVIALVVMLPFRAIGRALRRRKTTAT